MNVTMRNNGREAVIHSKSGEYIAYAPLEKGVEKISVKTPDGKIVSMDKTQLLETIVYNAPNELERSPSDDSFEKSGQS